MPLSRIQKRRIYHVLATGKRKRASREQLLSAIVTHRTETNYGNPAGGHGTSSGWRQQISGAGVKSRNRQSIRKQAGYYFDEARGKRGTPGQISNAVQRSAFPQKASDPAINREAQKILAAFEAGRLGRVPGGGKPGSREVTRTVTPGVDNSGVRRDAKLAYLSQRGSPDALLNLAAALKGAGDVPAVTKTSVVRTPGRRVVRGRGGRATSTDIARIAGKARSMGLRVSGNSGVNPGGAAETSGHTSGSNHYARARKKGWQGALDISGDPRKMARLAGYLSKRYGRDLEELIYRGPGSKNRHNIKRGRRVGKGFYSKHEDHVHVADLD